MRVTLTEMHIMAKEYQDFNTYSLFNHLKPAKGEGSIDTLTSKGAYQDGEITPEVKALLDVLAYPDTVAKFQLQQLEVNMRKQVYKRGNQKILVEFHREEIILSTFDTEIASIRTEIANHVGASFQKHSQLKQTLTGEELLCFAGLADWLRRIALGELINEKMPNKLDVATFADFVKTPFKLGLLSQIITLTHLNVPDLEGCRRGLLGLKSKGLVEDVTPSIEIGKSTILFGINFLVPNMSISLELYDLALEDKVLTAKEMIVQASPKDALSLSANVSGYLSESLTSSEVLEKILAYLSCPSLSASVQN